MGAAQSQRVEGDIYKFRPDILKQVEEISEKNKENPSFVKIGVHEFQINPVSISATTT